MNFRLFGAVAIGNIVSSLSLQTDLMTGGALTPLVAVANTADLETQRCIGYALCNLAADPAKRLDIVREGGIAALISLACSEDSSDQFAAMCTLRALISHEENRRLIWRENICEALALGVMANNEDVRQETSYCYLALSANDENKIDIVKSESCLNSLSSLTKDANVACVRLALGCLANLSERHDTHSYLLQSNFHGEVLQHFEGHDIGLLREVSRLVANLASNYLNHSALLVSRCPAALKFNHEDALVSRFCTLCLVNLSANTENHDALDALHCIGGLVSLAACRGHVWNDLDLRGIASRGQADEARNLEAKSFVQEFHYDRDTRRYAVLAIGNLAMSAIFHPELMKEKSLNALSACLDSNDIETRFSAAYCINKLSASESNLHVLGSSGIPCRLVDVMFTGSEHSSAQALAALRHLATLPENRAILVEANILAPLVSKASGRNEECLREMAACVCQLSLSESLRLPLVSSNLIPPLMILCEHEDEEISRQACGAIANMAENPRTHAALIADGNTLHRMIFLMNSRQQSVHREAARCVSNLLTSVSCHRLFLEDNGLASLNRLSKGTIDIETQYNCALIFRKLSPVIANHAEIFGMECYSPLIALTRVSDTSVARTAMASLRDLASNVNYKTLLAECGGLQRALELSVDAELTVRILALGILRHLSISSRIKRPMVGLSVMGIIVANIEDRIQDMDILRQCAAILSSLAENTENQLQLLQEKVNHCLVHLSEVRHPEVEQDTAKCFASITANAESHSEMFGELELHALFRLMSSNEENCVRDALISVGNIAIVSTKQVFIVEYGGLSFLSKALKSQFLSCQKYAARAVYRLAAHSSNQALMIEGEGSLVLDLNRLCGSEAVSVRKYAAMALCNISSRIDNQKYMSGLGCTTPLISLLNDNEEVCRLYAAMTLTNLSTDPTNQVIIMRQGAVPLLIAMAVDRDQESCRYAGLALANLSSNRLNKNVVVKLGALKPLKAMAFSKFPETQRAAGLALYNLSCATANHIPMVNDDIVSALVHLGALPDLDCKKYSIMTLANLAANIETRQHATRSGGLQSAVEKIPLNLYSTILMQYRKYT